MLSTFSRSGSYPDLRYLPPRCAGMARSEISILLSTAFLSHATFQKALFIFSKVRTIIRRTFRRSSLLSQVDELVHTIYDVYFEVRTVQTDPIPTSWPLRAGELRWGQSQPICLRVWWSSQLWFQFVFNLLLFAILTVVAVRETEREGTEADLHLRPTSVLAGNRSLMYNSHYVLCIHIRVKSSPDYP